MLRKTRLFTPGPTPLLPAAQNAIAAADMHHRTAEFREIFSRTLADLKTFIGTNNDVPHPRLFGYGRDGSCRFQSYVAGRESSCAECRQVWRALARSGQSLWLRRGVLSVPYGETFDLAK